jgi:hypothetical protein
MKLQKFLILATLSFAGCRAEQAPVEASGSSEQGFGDSRTTSKVSVLNNTKVYREIYPFLVAKELKKQNLERKIPESWNFPYGSAAVTTGRYVARFIKVEDTWESEMRERLVRYDASFANDYPAVARQFRGAGIAVNTPLTMIRETVEGVPSILALMSFHDGPREFKDKQFWVPADNIRSLELKY